MHPNSLAAFALAPLLFLQTLTTAQSGKPPPAAVPEEIPEVFPPSPYDRVVDLEFGEHDEALEGYGPVRWVDYEARFSGGLHLWAEGEIDLLLRVEDDSAEVLAEDRASGGGSTPYLRLEVKRGQRLHVAVVAEQAGAAGTARLHLVAAVESEATLAAAEDAAKKIVAAGEPAEEGRLDWARVSIAEVVASLRSTEGARWSDVVARQLRSAAESAGRNGDLASARTARGAARAHRERTLPADHPDLLSARKNLAVTLFKMGDFAGARTLEEAVLEARERTLPEDHPDLLSARRNLAETLFEMGAFAGARALEEAVLEACERALTEDHPDLLSARKNLAGTLFEMGDFAGARALEEVVLEARERMLPADHPDLLSARRNLAGTLFEMGDLEGARMLEEAVLEARQRTLPEDHPDLLSARQNLAVTMGDMGDFAAARALEEAVLEARQRTLPEDHPDLLYIRQNLAMTLGKLGDLAGARALEEAVLEARQRTLPEDHPDLLSARQNLAVTMGDMGDFAAARALEEAVLEARERTLPEDHPKILYARQNLAGTLFDMGDVEGARALDVSVLEVRERTLPADHPDLLSARMNVAVTMKKSGALEDARALEESVLEARERTLPADHPDILYARQNLAGTLRTMGDLAGARALDASVLEARERTLPEDHPDLLVARQNLAGTLRAMGDLAGARALLPGMVEGMRLRALETAALSSRGARQVVGSDSSYLAHALFLSELGGSAEHRSLAELVETRRAVSVEGLRAQGATGVDPEIVALRAALARSRQALNTVVMRGAQEGLASEEFRRAASDRDRAQRALRKALLERGVRIGAIDLGELAAALPPDGAAVGFLVYERWELNPQTSEIEFPGMHLLAHVVHPDGSLARVELGAAQDLNELVERWRAAIGKPLERGVALTDEGRSAEDRAREAGEELRERLLDPILAAVGEQARTLYVCPDDLVYLVPLDALPLGQAAVGERYSMRTLSSFRELVAPRPASRAEPSLLALGGAAFGAEGQGLDQVLAPAAPMARSVGGAALPESFPPLLQTAIEAEAVAQLFERSFGKESVVLQGSGATKAALAQALVGKRYVHLATHGWFAPETVKSMLDEDPGARNSTSWTRLGASERITGFAPLTLCGLALAGANRGADALGRRPGIITAEELSFLPLQDCELAVLSACETNVGPRRAGQGIQSLGTALHAAGARSTITTLWKVDDAVARRLMELFYTYLWVEHTPIDRALWRAKMELRAAGASTRDWAPWVLSGGVQ